MKDESKETVSLSWIWWARTCKIGQSVLRNLNWKIIDGIKESNQTNKQRSIKKLFHYAIFQKLFSHSNNTLTVYVLPYMLFNSHAILLL